MSGSAQRLGADGQRHSSAASYRVMYMAKRPSYELVLAIPEEHPHLLGVDQGVIRLRLKAQTATQDFVLNLAELEDFYAGLGQLLAYIEAERERRKHQL